MFKFYHIYELNLIGSICCKEKKGIFGSDEERDFRFKFFGFSVLDFSVFFYIISDFWFNLVF